MQSDWHRYNLKRRVAALPPLTAEAFSERVIANKATAAATAARARFEKRCEACEKTFYSEGAYANHLGSQKHRILAARWNARGTGTETESLVDSTFSLGEPMEVQSTTTESTLNGDMNGAVDEDAEEEFEDVVDRIRTTGLQDAGSQDPLSARPGHPTPTTAAAHTGTENPISPDGLDDGAEYDHKADLKQCLFCNYESPTLDLNIHHMGRQHGFFIPEKDYLVDLDGLINYLSETIQVLHTCLFCHKTLHSAHGIQTHMRDRGHCMVAYATEDEQMDIGEFYDFRSTYSDDESDDDDEADVDGGVSLGVKRPVKTTVLNDDGEDVEMDGDEDGWESDSTLSSVPTDEITSVPMDKNHKHAKLDLHRHHSHTDPRPHKNTDGSHSHAHQGPTAVYHDDYELHLPSGRTAGHRSLRTYYRQNLRNYPTPEERAQQRLLTGSDERHVSDDENDAASEATETGGRGRQIVSRANGGLGMIGVSDEKKREIRAVEKREQKRAQRQQNRYQAGNERRHNFQKHFRDPLLQ